MIFYGKWYIQGMYFTSHEVIDPELTLVYIWFMHAHSKPCGYASSEIANVMQRRTYFGLQGGLIFIAAHGLADIAVAAFEGGVIGGVAAAGAGRRRCARRRRRRRFCSHRCRCRGRRGRLALTPADSVGCRGSVFKAVVWQSTRPVRTSLRRTMFK